MKDVLAAVVAAVEAEGELLAAEFLRPDGPRGRRGSAPIDREIEERLREKLQAVVPCRFVGEETGVSGDETGGAVWMVDPQDGTFEFTSGKRGSAVSVGLLKNKIPVLGVVHSPLSPDRGADTIAWAESAGPIRRNGVALDVDLSQRLLGAGEFVFATASSANRPGAWARAVAPARYIAMPSIAYRLARIAAGDGAATLSIHGLNEYDIAAGMALIRAAGGVVLDAEGKPVVLEGRDRRLSGCFAGAPGAAAQLARHDWKSLENEPPQKPRVALGFPRPAPEAQVARAQGCLLGQVIGDSLGSLVEFKSAAEIERLFPRGVRELADGGVYHTIAGQPTDASEMALALARCLVEHKEFIPDKVLDAYRSWMTTRPVDIGTTTERGLLGLHAGGSESNGSLMRVSPLGVWAAGDPARAAAAAREDSALTHRNPVCIEACAGYAAAIAAGVAGQGTEANRRSAMREAALANCRGKAREAIERASLPHDFQSRMGWVLLALENAFVHLRGSDFEEALVSTVGQGGDTDTNAAICGALLGAASGKSAIPSRWILPVLACRSTVDAGAPRPRPAAYWPDDILELAEALLGSRR